MGAIAGGAARSDAVATPLAACASAIAAAAVGVVIWLSGANPEDTSSEAAEVADAYRDGVWFVEFGSIRDPLLAPTSVAQVLGVQEKAGAPLTDTLCTHLKGRQSLLILDNCEHLLDACTRLAGTLLRSATDVTIIATSREPLQAAGEQMYPLLPLSLPDSSGSAETMRHSGAVQLFVERVQRQLPDFELTPAYAPIVAKLCIHLDGIPLALELAAARARSLSIDQIKARLHVRFNLLASGNRTALPRQQTLRATLDWSFDLLAEQERVLLRRLAIFAGGFTLEAASSVASGPTIDERAVINLLSQLVVRSLVIADTSNRDTRYRLLETTRAYAMEKLAEAGETDAVKRQHARYFRDLRARSRRLAAHVGCRVARRLPSRARQRSSFARLGTRGRRRTGIRHCARRHFGPDVDDAVALGRRCAAARGRCQADGSHTSKLDQARLWLWQGLLWRHLAPAQALAAFERAIGLYRGLGDRLGLGHSLVRLGHALTLMGQFDRSESALAEAFSILEGLGLPKVLGFYFTELAFLQHGTGDPTGARVHCEKALSLYRQSGTEFAVHATLVNLADVIWALGDLDAAMAAFLETVAMLRESATSRKSSLGFALSNLAGVCTERGELDEALVAAREALPLLKDEGYAWMDHFALRGVLADKLVNAARLAGYTDSAFVAKGSSRDPNEARARDRLQALLRQKLDADELARLLAEGATMSEDEACRMALED